MNPDAASFSAHIRAEHEVFQEFRRTLQLEQDALIKGETECLLELAPRKSELIEKLSVLSAERQRNLAAAGQQNSPAGMAAWLDAMGADAATRQLWRELLDLARDAERVNRSNGVLIETHLRHNQQALAVLKAAANPGGLYDPKGLISSSTSGRSRDKA